MSTPPSAVERYLTHLRTERRLAINTLGAYSRDLAVLTELAGDTALQGLGTPHIRRFAAALHGKGQSPRSLARTLSAWRGFYDWLGETTLALE